MRSVGLPRISITIRLDHQRAKLASFVENWHALRMTSGFGWGRFFLIICLGSPDVCLPPGQMLGAEQVAETRLVYLELSGEPAADVAMRLRAQGLEAGEIAKLTRVRISEIAIQQKGNK